MNTRLPSEVGPAVETYQHMVDKRYHHIADTLFGPRSGGERSEPERSGPNTPSSAARILRHSYRARLVFVQCADQFRSEINLPNAGFHRFQTNKITHERFTDIPAHASSVNLTVAFHPAPFPTPWIGPGLHLFHAPAVLSKHIRGRFHAEAFMRPLSVIMSQPTCASLLLFLHRRLRINSHLSLVNPMELLMRAILTGPPRRDEF